MYHYNGTREERLFTVGSTTFYHWDFTVLFPDTLPQLLYKPIDEPPEYSEAAGASPLPAYYDVLYNDQLITSFNNLTRAKN
ncbi:hypothetical protein V3C99_015774 [Haemonchus contortus]